MDRQLQARSLTCRYGQRTVLRELSLAARPGEVLVLLGPNGAGKTTLLRALSRMMKAAGGSVLLGERDIQTFGELEYARRVALAPQSEQREWPLTVAEAVLLGRAPHRGWLLPFRREDHAAVERAIEAAGLGTLRDRPITELSGGEWRRMVVARALAMQADVLLLDEPTTGLDLRYQIEILRIVRNLAKQHALTVVMTLHDLNQAAACGDRLAVLSGGNVAAVGPPAEVLTAELIQHTFGAAVTIQRHPSSSTPLVVPVFDAGT